MVVLVLAGTQLIFFIAAHMVLCFGLVTKTVLIITQGCVSCCEQCSHSIKAFPASPIAPPVRGLGWAGGCEGTRPGAGGKEGERGTFRVTAFDFPGNHYMWWSPAFLDMAGHLPADGKLRMNSFVCFGHTHGFCFTS